jgi:uncharacterized DUF497 family protein
VTDAYDPAKDAANIAKHGISLPRAFDMQIVATQRDGMLRPISLRRAYAKEMKRYVKA